MNNEIVLIDYGMGNLRSVAKALEQAGGQVRLTSSPSVVSRAAKCVVPGVGAFGDAMKELKKRKLIEPIQEHLVSGKPFLGICLGLQLLFEESEEGNCKGLGFLKGKVVRFRFQRTTNPSTSLRAGDERRTTVFKIPHMGWNGVKSKVKSKKSKIKEICPLLKKIPDGSYFYFVHSYYVEPVEQEIIAATTEYGIEFTSMIWKGNIFATQFHPEKSQETGLKLLKNFVKL